VANTRSKLVKGTIWLTAARSLANLFTLVSTVIIARILSPADFGIVAIATTVVAIVASVTELSLVNALIHHESPTEDYFHMAWTMECLRGLAVAALILVSTYPVVVVYEEPRLLPIMLALAGNAAVLGFCSNPKMVTFTRELDFRQGFAITVLSKLGSSIVSIALAIYLKNYWAIVGGLVVGPLISFAIAYWIVPYWPKFTLRYMRELWSFSSWLSFGQIVNTINWKFDQLLVGGFLGRAELGYYNVGDQLAYMPTREATAPLAPALFPAFARLREDRERLVNAYERAQTLSATVALPVGVGVALVAESLVRVILGEKWLPAVIVIQVLASVFAIQTLSSTVQPLAMAVGETRRLFVRDTAIFIARIPTIFIGIYFGGLTGLVVARAITGTISIPLNMLLVRQIVGLSMRRQWMANARTLAATIIMVFAVLIIEVTVSGLIPTISDVVVLAVSTIVGAAAYVASIIAFWMVCGRPDGPEQFILQELGKLRARLCSE